MVSGYLFEGHLTTEPEPPPPAWLVAQNVLTNLVSSQGAEDNTTENNGVPDYLQQMMSNIEGFDGVEDISEVIEASLRVCIELFYLIPWYDELKIMDAEFVIPIYHVDLGNRRRAAETTSSFKRSGGKSTNNQRDR